MILLLDIGNSRAKWALFDGRVLQAGASCDHRGQPGESLAGQALPKADHVWVANVTGADHEREIAAALEARCAAQPRFARTQPECSGLRVAYDKPERLGVDRWLSMLAVWSETRQPFCVVNAGTALTYDEVREGGRHAGGLIAPGLATAWNALRSATRFELQPAPSAYTEGLGTDTESCVRQGTLYACAGLVERAARTAPPARFLTGGDAAALQPHLPGWTVRPNLVMEGLLVVARGATEAG